MLYRRQVEFGSTSASRHLEYFRILEHLGLYSGSDLLGILWLFLEHAKNTLVLADGRVSNPMAKHKCSFIAADHVGGWGVG